jgi:hypothetical protein
LSRRRDALVEEAASRLAVLESEFGFRREAADGAVLSYRRGDELVKLTRTGTRLLGEMIFIEFLPADSVRLLYSSGMIKRGKADDYAQELQPMVDELLAALSKLRRQKDADE